MKTRAQRNEVATRPNTQLTLPGDWADKLASGAKDASAVEQPEVQAFSTRAGVLSYGETPLPDNKVQVIILEAVFMNSMFISKFDPANIVPPLCFAMSGTGEDMAPHENSFKAQNETCDGCPNAEWGSDENSPSGKGKACKETRRLVVIPADALTEGVEKAKMATLNVPVTSTKSWGTYVHTLAATAKRPPWSVITEISLKPDPKRQFTVNFAAVDVINAPEILDQLDKMRARAQQVGFVPYPMMTEEQFKAITEEREKPAKKRKF